MEDCEVCNKYKEHFYWNHEDLKGKQFYQIMKGDFSHQMKLPKKFSHHFEGELSETVHLKSPSGKTWQVGLTKTATGMSLRTGWNEFVEDHHIQEGDLMIFKYSGNSCFEISMFDESHCEKAASYVFINSNLETQERSKDSLEILNVQPSGTVIMSVSSDDTRQESSSPIDPEISRQNNIIPTNYQRAVVSCNTRVTRSKYGSAYIKNNLRKSCTRDNVKQEESDDISNRVDLTHPNLYMPHKKLTDEEEKKILMLVNTVRSNNPRFISVIHPYNVGNAKYFTIPTYFAADHLPSQNALVFLRVPGWKKNWSVSYIAGKVSSGFCGKWRTFAHENNLREGDICLFELMKNHGNITMQVHIVRAASGSGSVR